MSFWNKTLLHKPHKHSITITSDEMKYVCPKIDLTELSPMTWTINQIYYKFCLYNIEHKDIRNYYWNGTK